MKKIVYHGGRFGKNTFWFSSSPRVAGSYGKITWINQIPQFDDYETYEIELKNPFVVNAKEAYYYEIKTPTKMKNDWHSSTVDTDGIVDWARKNGYDGVIIKNVMEGQGCSDIADDYVLFNRNFRKIESQDMLLLSFFPNGFGEMSKIDQERSSDFYNQKYVYDFGTIYVHAANDFETFDLYKALPKPNSTEILELPESFSLVENVVSLKDFKYTKIKDNLKDFSDSLLQLGEIENPSNPYS